MSDWNPEKYLMFKKQRTQPAIDLAKRIINKDPKTVVDIGCGPGNSTVILKEVFPKSKILGIDSSENMIKKARSEHPDIDFQVCEAQKLTGKYDLLFSNACLQWIPNHEKLIPDLMEKLTQGGTLAVQIPMNQDETLFKIIKEIASDSKWNFQNTHFEQNDTLDPEAYYDILSKYSSEFEIWETVYYHVLPSHQHMIEWIRATRLRPYLDVLNDDQKAEFESEILKKAKNVYPITVSGEVIFKFRRFFFIAKK